MKIDMQPPFLGMQPPKNEMQPLSGLGKPHRDAGRPSSGKAVFLLILHGKPSPEEQRKGFPRGRIRNLSYKLPGGAGPARAMRGRVGLPGGHTY